MIYCGVFLSVGWFWPVYFSLVNEESNGGYILQLEKFRRGMK